MNERIRELGLKAQTQAAKETIQNSFSYEGKVFEKFAELIVRECANTAYQSLYEDRVFDDSPHNIRCNVMDAIKKHFGVKE